MNENPKQGSLDKKFILMHSGRITMTLSGFHFSGYNVLMLRFFDFGANAAI